MLKGSPCDLILLLKSKASSFVFCLRPPAMKITAALGVVALLCLASFQMVAAKNYFVEETFDNLKDSLSDKCVLIKRGIPSTSAPFA